MGAVLKVASALGVLQHGNLEGEGVLLEDPANSGIAVCLCLGIGQERYQN